MSLKILVLVAGIFLASLSLSFVSSAQAAPSLDLTVQQQSIVTIAAFTANGNMDKLKTALNEGLDAGLTVNEIKEVLVQMYAYTGFPRSLNAINNFIAVMEDREKRGFKDEIGPEATSLPAGKSSLEFGSEVQTKLIGAPATGKYIAFTPAIDTFLKAHLFGDIFVRGILDFQSREIATISALSSMEGVNSQLQSHFNVGLNTGLTETQLRNLISVLAGKVGKAEAANATEVLNKVIIARSR